MCTNQLSRRDFCTKSVQAAIGLAAINALPQAVLSQTTHGLAIDLTLAANSALKTIGGAEYATYPATGTVLIIIRNSSTQVYAISSVCTHMGCQVNLPVNNVITCPCHGSQYTTQGVVTQGPALANLTQYTAQLSGNFIYVDAQASSVAPPSGSVSSNRLAITVSDKHIHINAASPEFQPLRVHLYDIRGKLAAEFNTGYQVESSLSVQDIAKGEYVVHIVTKSAGTIVRHIVID